MTSFGLLGEKNKFQGKVSFMLITSTLINERARRIHVFRDNNSTFNLGAEISTTPLELTGSVN